MPIFRVDIQKVSMDKRGSKLISMSMYVCISNKEGLFFNIYWRILFDIHNPFLSMLNCTFVLVLCVPVRRWLIRSLRSFCLTVHLLSLTSVVRVLFVRNNSVIKFSFNQIFVNSKSTKLTLLEPDKRVPSAAWWIGWCILILWCGAIGWR